MSVDEETVASIAMGTVEVVDRDGTVWVPIRRDGLTRWGRRDYPVTWAQVFPSYRKLAAEFGPLEVLARDRYCTAFDSDGWSCCYDRDHAIGTHLLTPSPWAPPDDPENPSRYVGDDQLDEYGGHVAQAVAR